MTVLALLLASGFAASGCTAGTSEAGSSASPSASASPTPTEASEPTPGPEAAAEERQLPMPLEDIADWAASAVPGPDAAGYTAGWSGWMSEHTSAHHSSDLRSIAAGTYQGQIACRGEGTITLSAGDLDGSAASAPVTCANSTIAFDVTTSATGLQVVLDLEGAPTIYSVSFVAVL